MEADLTECSHLMLEGTCTICKPAPARLPPRDPERDSLVPQELSFPVLATLIEKAAPEWISSEDLQEGVKADPVLGRRIREACDGRETEMTYDTLAGNVVAFFSKAWTEGTNEHAAPFERRGYPGGYEYRPKWVADESPDGDSGDVASGLGPGVGHE